MISTEEFSPISDHTVAGDQFQDKSSTVAMDNNSPEQSTKETSSTVANSTEPSFAMETTVSSNENWDIMNSEEKGIHSSSTEKGSDGKSVSNGTTLEYGTEETGVYSSTASKAWTETPSVSLQKTHNVQTSTEIPWIEVTTVPHQNVSEFQERMENTEITSLVPDVESQLDCNSLIIILSCTFAVVLLLVSIGCLCGLWKIRRTWRRKFEEEKHKLDAWTKSTTDNTIVNENYDFYDTDIPMQRGENLRQPEIDTSMTISDAQSSSAAKRSSTASTGSRLSKLLPSKLFIGRSKSSYSDDSLIVNDPGSRGRASTFAHGKRTKIKHDTHKLVDHVEAEPHGILETVDNILKPQNKHIVTEL